MRKSLKDNILEIFKTFYEAHSSVKKLIDKKDFKNALIILGDCQNTAIQLGTAIENSEGEGFVTIGLLEEYCEAVYEAAESISEKCSSVKLREQLDKILIKAENSIKDVKVKLEIVFMPYKASMWDSLESVWKAANDDPDCNVYVVPIPYYDRNPDYSFGERHYEGAEFPEYVPIMHYEAYSPELMRPDVIYIHNPYDGNNYVTSVDPKFYSSELKKYTECLVYIPYFVVSYTVPEHFCTTLGCVYADKVFVQSEIVREKYIETFTQTYGSKAGDPKDKFVALGSPKFGSIINAEQNKPVLPSEWNKIISGKKVILYNTSVSAILNGNEQYLDKICSVLNFFSNRSDVVLWWRPHPLSVAVYESMRHQLIGKYLDIISQYKSSGIGIYDDTPDLQRAIIYSDAYYGDRSSLVALYQLTGKPVLIQNTDLCDYNSLNIELAFEDIYDDGEYLWFSAMLFNGLFRMKKETMKPEFIGIFPAENKIGIRLYSGIAKHNGKLYFAPLSAKEIAVYDIKKGVFEKISFKSTDDTPYGKLYSISVYENTLIFIPYMYSYIICYNTETGELSYHDYCRDKIMESKNYDKDLGYFRKGVIIEDKLYLPCICANKMVIFDIRSQRSEVIDVTDNNISFHGIYNNGNKLWLIPCKGQPVCVCMDISTGEIRTLKLPCSEKESTFIDICSYGGKLRMYPYYVDSVVEIDMGSETAEAIETSENHNSDKLYNGHYMFAKNIGGSVYAYDLQNETLVVYDQHSGKKEYDLNLSDADKKRIKNYKNNLVENIYFSTDCADSYNYSEETYDISQLAEYYAQEFDKDKYAQAVQFRSDVRRKTLSNPDGTAGRKIHEYVRKTVSLQ